MALAQCPDCGGSVSTTAPACPHCGRPAYQPYSQQQQWYPQQQPITVKPTIWQDRNVGCLAACLVFIVLPFFVMMAWCGHR